METDILILTSPMLSKLVIEPLVISAFLFFNLVCTLATIFFCLFRFGLNNFVLTRLSFIFAAFICLFYQIPLVLFSPQLEVSLQHPWNYALTVNGGMLVLTLWGVLSRRFDFYQNTPVVFEISYVAYILTGAMGLGLLWVYFLGIPYYCTGIYALLFDPMLTLLARELSVKLLGTSWATISLGAYANAIAPLFVLFSIWLIRDSVLTLRPLKAVVGALGGFIAIATVLTSGTKGLLLPSLFMLPVGTYFWCKTRLSMILTISFCLIFMLFCVTIFEIFREKNPVSGGTYDFAACSVEIGSCQKSHELLESMKTKDSSLGITVAFVIALQSRLTCLCKAGGDVEICPTPSRQNFFRRPEIQESFRFTSMSEAILYRAFVVPFQVSTWHFMYSEHESVDGIKTLPFAKKVFGASLNMPEIVYQKYASIYSLGNITSTGTSPTSFFFTYPAYLGWAGFLLALGCIIGFDLFLAKFAMFVSASLIPPLTGIVMIICINFISSDFATVLISHGGLAGIFAIFILNLFLRKRT